MKQVHGATQVRDLSCSLMTVP